MPGCIVAHIRLVSSVPQSVHSTAQYISKTGYKPFPITTKAEPLYFFEHTVMWLTPVALLTGDFLLHVQRRENPEWLWKYHTELAQPQCRREVHPALRDRYQSQCFHRMLSVISLQCRFTEDEVTDEGDIAQNQDKGLSQDFPVILAEFSPDSVVWKQANLR